MTARGLARRCLVEAATGRVVVPLVWWAATFRERLVGLMGRAGLPSGEGMVFADCSAIHTCGMRFDLDIVFFDKEWRICRIARRVRPWRMRIATGARHVLEMASGGAAAAGLRVGSVYRLEDRDPDVYPG